MTKQIEIHGQRVQLYSLDEGHSWSSSRQSIVAYKQRKHMLRCELQKTFERLDAIQDPAPNNVVELGIRKSPRGH
jgi:hypothetical protein